MAFSIRSQVMGLLAALFCLISQNSSTPEIILMQNFPTVSGYNFHVLCLIDEITQRFNPNGDVF